MCLSSSKKGMLGKWKFPKIILVPLKIWKGRINRIYTNACQY
jgi:hypothetical protein